MLKRSHKLSSETEEVGKYRCLNPEAKRRLSSIFSVKLLTTSEDNLSKRKRLARKNFSRHYVAGAGIEPAALWL